MLMVYGLAQCVVLCLWQTQCNPSDSNTGHFASVFGENQQDWKCTQQ